MAIPGPVYAPKTGGGDFPPLPGGGTTPPNSSSTGEFPPLVAPPAKGSGKKVSGRGTRKKKEPRVSSGGSSKNIKTAQALATTLAFIRLITGVRQGSPTSINPQITSPRGRLSTITRGSPPNISPQIVPTRGRLLL